MSGIHFTVLLTFDANYWRGGKDDEKCHVGEQIIDNSLILLRKISCLPHKVTTAYKKPNYDKITQICEIVKKKHAPYIIYETVSRCLSLRNQPKKGTQTQGL